jgi:hypothetical protein
LSNDNNYNLILNTILLKKGKERISFKSQKSISVMNILYEINYVNKLFIKIISPLYGIYIIIIIYLYYEDSFTSSSDTIIRAYFPPWNSSKKLFNLKKNHFNENILTL